MNAKKDMLLSDDEDLEFLQSLKNDFYLETIESFEKAEASLLSFESTKNDLSLLDYKRTLHSVKGSAKAVDEAEFAVLLHKLEDSITGEKNDHFFDINFKFLDFAKKYIESSKSNNESDMHLMLKSLNSLF
jgi:chemotaxis protein histidine kinase CheA